MGIDIGALKANFLPYLNSLGHFRFSFLNPLFWIFLLVLFLMLLRFWYARKSFSFCLIVAIILLATTGLEDFIAGILAKNGEGFDPVIIRVLSLIVISIISLYYFFIREN
ncbi:MAG: hypothetical protein Q8O30_09135 [Candidatus Omnitrophota bacterium]|nr:hypothetical protein [Candidatus Omnitrophota bacterium]